MFGEGEGVNQKSRPVVSISRVYFVSQNYSFLPIKICKQISYRKNGSSFAELLINDVMGQGWRMSANISLEIA